LRRLLQNLISNAIKYTPKGRVLVGCRRIGTDKVRVEVWDTGIGIPEDKQKNVFREFERLTAGARTASGLGLGLSIVERLGKVLEHPITLRSKPHKGSVFTVDLPVVAAAPTSHEAREATPHAHLPLAGLCVLTIDNEPRILEGMEALLSGWGCKVVAAATEREAGGILARLGILPDVLIADYHLDEGSDGLAAIAALRSDAGLDIPAILITADRTLEIREAATAQGVIVLNKPVKPAALRALLTQWRVQRAAE
jgi:CheY-like chemotaxis protein